MKKNDHPYSSIVSRFHKLNDSPRVKIKTRTRKKILQLQADGKCLMCGEVKTTLKVVPIIHPALGCPISTDNLMAVCASCATKKASGDLPFIGSGQPLDALQESLLTKRNDLLLNASLNHLVQRKATPAVIKSLKNRFINQRVSVYAWLDEDQKKGWFVWSSSNGSLNGKKLFAGILRYQGKASVHEYGKDCLAFEVSGNRFLDLVWLLINNGALVKPLFPVDTFGDDFKHSWGLALAGVSGIKKASAELIGNDLNDPKDYSKTRQAVYQRKAYKLKKRENLEQKKARLITKLGKEKNQILLDERRANNEVLDQLEYNIAKLNLELLMLD